MANPEPKGFTGKIACQETSGHAQAYGVMRWGICMTWRKLDCLKPNLQKAQFDARRKDACNRRQPCSRICGRLLQTSGQGRAGQRSERSRSLRVRVLMSSSRQPAGCLTGTWTPARAPSYPESARTGRSFREGRRTASRCSRAAVMSWTPPGSTSETHSGMPRGVNSAWMLPPKACVLPEYQRSISLPFLLVVFSFSRSVATTLPSRIRYGSSCSLAASRASARPGARAARTSMISSMYR